MQTPPAGALLQIQADSPFLLHWTGDDWQNSKDARSQGTAIGIEFVDIPLQDRQENVIRFTFLWMEENRWEGRDYTVNVRQEDAAAKSRRNLRRRKPPGQHVPTVGSKSVAIKVKSTLASLRAGLSITPRGVSILTILQFDTLLLIFGQLCGGI